jgi:hypothetical protein
LRVLPRVLEQTVATVRHASAGSTRWLGHRVWVLDGSSFSRPEGPALQAQFGQPGGQWPGGGFPVARWLALFDVATGMLLRSSVAPLRTHDMARCAGISDDLERGDVVLGDRGFCSDAHLALLFGRGRHAVFRIHQNQIVDFRPGRPRATPGLDQNPAGRPHSRWILAQGQADQVVVWTKPKTKPAWMSDEEFATLPAEVTVRERRYRVETPGFRMRVVTLVTTLVEASADPAAELAELSVAAGRWR